MQNILLANYIILVGCKNLQIPVMPNLKSLLKFLIINIKNRHFQYFQYLKPPSKEMSRHKSIKFVLQRKEKIGMSMVQIA